MTQFTLNSPPKPHAFVSLPLQSASIDIASLITSFPADIQDLILSHLGADHLHIRDQTGITLRSLSRLDMSHHIYSQMFPLDSPYRFQPLSDVTSEGFYRSIARDYYDVLFSDIRMRPNDDSMVFNALYDSASKEVSNLIHIKGFYVSITKDYSHVNTCIEKFNCDGGHKSSSDISSIKDMITKLDSYKS